MIDWLRMRAAAKLVRRVKRNQLEMERERMWHLKEESWQAVLKAKSAETGAYRRALETYVNLEDENLVQRVEKESSGEWHEIALSMVDQYAPGMLKGALKGAVMKNKAKINELAEKLLEQRVLSRVGEMEKKGEIRRVDRSVLEANK